MNGNGTDFSGNIWPRRLTERIEDILSRKFECRLSNRRTACIHKLCPFQRGFYFSNLEKALNWHPTSMRISPNCRTLWFLSYIIQRDNTPISLKIIILESGPQFLTQIKETYQCVEPNINGGVTRQIYYNKCLYSGMKNSSATESVPTAIILYPI